MSFSGNSPRKKIGYLELFRLGGTVPFFGAAAIGRIGVSMTALGILWLVTQSTGSFVVAGVVVGAFALAEAAVGPQIARAIDLRGQLRVVPVVLAIHALALTALIVVALLHAPLPLICCASLLAGASIPQLGVLSIARWSHFLDTPAQLNTALSLEAAVNDVAFLAGPSLVAVLSAATSPVVAVISAGTLTVLGGSVLVAQRSTEPPVGAESSTRMPSERLLRGPFFGLVAVNLGLGLFFGSIQLSVTAFATERHALPLAGFLYSILSLASLGGGLAFGARGRSARPGRLMLATSCYFAVATATLFLASTIPWLGVQLAVVGAAIAPLIIVSSVLTERAFRPPLLTRAFTWMNSASAVGIAISATVSGIAIDEWGSRGGFLCAAGSVLLILVATAVSQRAFGAAGTPRRA